jgi:ABC-type uncharacterized transport system auxiliary subunit
MSPNKLCEFLACASLLVLLNGCAWTKTPVNIVLAPQPTQPLRGEAKSSLKVGEVKDSRFTSDPAVLVQKQNAYGKTTGAYVAQRPVAELLREALVVALETNSFRVANSATPYELRGDLQDFAYESIQQSVFSVNVNAKLSVRFEVIDTANGNSVWRDTLLGRTQQKTGSGDSAFVIKTFSAAVNDLFHQLVADRTFRKIFE